MQKRKRVVYLDYASQTPIDKRVEKVVARYTKAERKGLYANPSAVHMAGVEAKKVLESARADVAKFINAHADEIIFTGSGTEANNLAIEGVAFEGIFRASSVSSSTGNAKPHLIISAIEHSSIMESVAALEKRGVEVTRLPVDSRGVVSLDELKKAIRPSTVLVSIMTVNNEIGTVEPIREIAKIIRNARTSFNTKDPERNLTHPLFHTDASQATLYCDLNVEKLGVDLLTIDSLKTYGPKSVGALYIKRGTIIEPIIHGGGQEGGLRSGTENVAGIAGFAKSLEIASAERGGEPEKKGEIERLVELRNYFIEQLKIEKRFPNLKIHGTELSGTEHVAHIINITLDGAHHDIDHEFFMLQLDARGIECSTKSACLRDVDESYVLKAINANQKSIRFSLGRYTTKKDIQLALQAIDEILAL